MKSGLSQVHIMNTKLPYKVVSSTNKIQTLKLIKFSGTPLYYNMYTVDTSTKIIVCADD